MQRRRTRPSSGSAFVAVWLVSCGLLAAGCGQKGPLYLPRKTKTVITTSAPASAPAATPSPAPATTPAQTPTPPAPTPDPAAPPPPDGAP